MTMMGMGMRRRGVDDSWMCKVCKAYAMSGSEAFMVFQKRRYSKYQRRPLSPSLDSTSTQRVLILAYQNLLWPPVLVTCQGQSFPLWPVVCDHES